MKKYILIGALIATTFLTGYSTCTDPEPPMPRMHATAYCLQGKTYTGHQVHKGIAATGDKSLLGKIVIVYQRLPDGSMGDYIGLYEVLDTGCKQGVLDIWCEDLDACQDFMDTVYKNGAKGRVYCFFKNAEG